MLTIKAEIQRDKLRQDGTYNVKIRFTKGKQVKRISDDCYALTSVTLSNNLTTIGDQAFCQYSLTSITIPNSVTTIGDYAFENCSALTSAIIGDGVTKIGNYAFVNCSALTSVKIGNSIDSIGFLAFYGCSNIAELSIDAKIPPICIMALDSINKRTCKLLVPKEGLDYYKRLDPWRDFLYIEENTTGIANVKAKQNTSARVYTLNGVKVLDNATDKELKLLPNGVYVVNGKKIVVK